MSLRNILKSAIVICWAQPGIRRWLTATVFEDGHILNRDGTLYMGRWVVIKERSWLPFAARIHHIATPDDGRALHDHPWPFTTIVLEGGYTEENIYGDTFGRYPGDVVKHQAHSFHTITDLNDPAGGSWSLFIYGKRQHTWGFLCGGRKIRHYDYTKWRQENETR